MRDFSPRDPDVLLLQQVFKELEHFGILAATEPLNCAPPAFDRCLWIPGDLDQFVEALQVAENAEKMAKQN